MKRKNSKIEISFWGVRGSIPTHSPSVSRFGGNTACVAIHFGKQWFVCDGGTGMRLLGNKLENSKEMICVFLSHLHWDHIFGLPFFKPFYQNKRKIILGGPSFHSLSFRDAIRKIMRAPYFPIGPVYWNSNVRWLALKPGRYSFGKVLLDVRRVQHAGYALGFQFHFPNGKRLVYVADQNLKLSNKKFKKWIQGADLLIHDSQFDLKEYKRHKDWGHSAFEIVLSVAMKSDLKNVVFSHHSPNATDRILERRFSLCQKKVKRLGNPIKCFFAKEGSTILV